MGSEVPVQGQRQSIHPLICTAP